DDKTKTTQSAKAVWVPNRNGIFLNIAAGLAEMIEVDFLYTGFNVEEAGTFPDNTQDFVSALNHCFTFSTLHNVMVQSPPIKMTKTQIVAELVKQNFPFELLWSCYRGGEQMCGLCESCLRLKRALNACGLQA
ncbi:MAG TPA: 7-cyano-7-deazaguanine synthase, partial [bacterium]|nr:7-cyano-7-deazaguanine synthase [bacterium]